ncbi:hypothetical protein [Microbulbifer thermotolerans]|uniref:hypothetical protein n=1 Tax=Microbulbifer thermotolerans TaxID=252514 RepID=UPI0008E633D5|nr:hypothetical protein [Microbulbifer thermotolerans]MCX2781049.1 hypothetical protein [Microbulbifer thermotolerans]MCX2806366.1 hypothetical protein [Microbulbifer thermotolerans]MCX2832927.1 hypothetical protein [Microbulbifer thermotolerans]SFC06991.1 hypothetical protein SAMN05660479_01041 [Microbulbifer thermotolerans]
MISVYLAVIFIATVFISALFYNSVSGNRIDKREYWRVPFLLVMLIFFISWSVNILSRYSGQHDSLLTWLTFFTVGAIFYLSPFIRDLVSFFNKPGQQASAFTAVPTIILAAAVAENFIPNIYDKILYGMYRMIIFFAVYFIVNSVITVFRIQINKYISAQKRQIWVRSSWIAFSFYMALVVISIYVGFNRFVLNWINESLGSWAAQIITDFLEFIVNINFLFV